MCPSLAICHLFVGLFGSSVCRLLASLIGFYSYHPLVGHLSTSLGYPSDLLLLLLLFQLLRLTATITCCCNCYCYCYVYCCCYCCWHCSWNWYCYLYWYDYYCQHEQPQLQPQLQLHIQPQQHVRVQLHTHSTRDRLAHTATVAINLQKQTQKIKNDVFH